MKPIEPDYDLMQEIIDREMEADWDRTTHKLGIAEVFPYKWAREVGEKLEREESQEKPPNQS